jgi:hypothetical protein
MKRLVAAVLAIVATSADAQSGGVPPPSHSKLGNDAQLSLPPPRLDTTSISGLIGYVGRDRLGDPGEIETPGTGYANEALWEPSDAQVTSPRSSLRGRKTGSTARGITR